MSNVLLLYLVLFLFLVTIGANSRSFPNYNCIYPFTVSQNPAQKGKQQRQIEIKSGLRVTVHWVSSFGRVGSGRVGSRIKSLDPVLSLALELLLWLSLDENRAINKLWTRKMRFLEITSLSIAYIYDDLTGNSRDDHLQY